MEGKHASAEGLHFILGTMVALVAQESRIHGKNNSFQSLTIYKLTTDENKIKTDKKNT